MALLQLVAYGAQDIYLGGGSNVSFHNVTYRRHESFTISSETDKAKKMNLRQMLRNMLCIHNNVTKKINLAEPFIVPLLKNTECPITFTEISGDFIECTVCKICYNFSDENVKKWFKTHSKCSLCRGAMNKTVKNIHGYNTVYSALKSESESKINYYYSNSDY